MADEIENLEDVKEEETEEVEEKTEGVEEEEPTKEDEEEETIDVDKISIETREKNEEKIEYGEDIDPDSELSHVTKAICSLMVWRDALMNDMCFDDRPPKPKNPNWMKDMNAKVKVLLEKYPNPVAPYTEVSIKKPNHMK